MPTRTIDLDRPLDLGLTLGIHAHGPADPTTRFVAGRFVPGMRFVICVTMGLERYPYRKFLPYSLLGGFFWAGYNCAFSYLIGSTRLGEYSLLSLLTSAAVTGGILTLLYKKLKHSYEEQNPTASPQPESVQLADSTA